MTVSAILKGNKDQLGRQKVYIRINEGEKRTFKVTGMRFHPDNFKNGKVVGLKDADKYNDLIREVILETESNKFFNREKGKDADFFKYCETSFKQFQHKSPETIRHHRSDMAKIKEFAPNLRLSQITVDWLYKYQAFCYDRGNSGNTVWGAMKFVRLIVLKAWREKLITDNPFLIYKMPKYRDPKREFLSEVDVQKIKDYAAKATAEKRFCALWFLIQCYTGLAFADIHRFSKNEIIDNRLIIYRKKTGEVISMPVTKDLRKLFEQVKYEPMHYTNIHYNRYLDDMAAELGLKGFTSHIGRHTAAVTWLNAGFSQEVVSKLLGHASLKTTAIYGKITNKRIDDEFLKLNSPASAKRTSKKA